MKFLNIFLIHSLIFINLESSFIYKKNIEQFIYQYPATKVIQCTHNYRFSYPEFPLYQTYKAKRFPNEGMHTDIFILEVPHGLAHIHPYGFVFINNIFIKETQLKDLDPFKEYEVIKVPELNNVKNVAGRVLVLNHLYSYNYGLFILDVLSSLALIEMHKVEYDYVWIPYNKEFIKEALDIWGIDSSKIIPLEHGQALQADTIIVPTNISQNPEVYSNANYYPDFLLKYVREKMLEGVQKKNIQMDFPEKIFISRKDASASRKIPNEDEVFALFEPLGYQRFEFSKFSMAEKIAVTHHAKSIVTFMGSGSTNILFASSDIKFYEIHQNWVEATFYFIAKSLGFHYDCMNDSTYLDLCTGMPWSQGRPLNIQVVKEFIKNHPEL